MYNTGHTHSAYALSTEEDVRSLEVDGAPIPGETLSILIQNSILYARHQVAKGDGENDNVDKMRKTELSLTVILGLIQNSEWSVLGGKRTQNIERGPMQPPPFLSDNKTPPNENTHRDQEVSKAGPVSIRRTVTPASPSGEPKSNKQLVTRDINCGSPLGAVILQRQPSGFVGPSALRPPLPPRNPRKVLCLPAAFTHGTIPYPLFVPRILSPRSRRRRSGSYETLREMQQASNRGNMPLIQRPVSPRRESHNPALHCRSIPTSDEKVVPSITSPIPNHPIQAGTPSMVIGEQEPKRRRSNIQFRPHTISSNSPISSVSRATWSPLGSLLAIAEGDSIIKIWDVEKKANFNVSLLNSMGENLVEGKNTAFIPNEVEQSSGKKKTQKIASMAWNSTGKLLLSAGLDGSVSIWSDKGIIQLTVRLHTAPILSAKWVPGGNSILTGSEDWSTCLFDGMDGSLIKRFNHHKSFVLDVDWRDSNCFASCSSDGKLFQSCLSSDGTMQNYEGHDSRINSIRFDPYGIFLASASDDSTVRVWCGTSSSQVACFSEHTDKVNLLRWYPDAKRSLLLASASADHTVRLWDVASRRSIRTLNHIKANITFLEFSPNSQFLASAALNGMLCIYDTEGELVHSIRSRRQIFDIGWNAAGDKICACNDENIVTIMDIRMMKVM